MTVLLGASSVPVGTSGGTAPERPLVSAFRLVSSAGQVTLSEDPYGMLDDPQGLTGVAFEPDLATSPSFDGAVLRSERPIVGQLDLLLPVIITTRDAQAAAAAAAEIRRVMGLYVEDSRVEVVLSDASTRTLRVRRWQDSSDSWHPMTWVHEWRKLPLRLRALDPWWSGDPRSITWVPAEAGGSFFPILPVRLSASAVLGEENPVQVGGDIDTWPTWTFAGPFDSVTVTRGDGLSFSVDEPLGVGETLTVKTDPRESGRVWHSSDGNWWQYLSPGSQLFPLRAVGDAVEVAAVASGAGTSVSVQWSPRYEVLV